MSSLSRRCLTLSIVASSLSFAPARADVTLPSVFSDHMVLQRDLPCPIWGRATPGEAVEVRFAEQAHQANAGEDGTWRVTLNAMPTSAEGRELVVQGTNEVRIVDVVVGEVWVCSGQSNMEWPVSASNDAEAEALAAQFPSLRLIKAQRTLSNELQSTVSGRWTVCTPANVPQWSAVAYYFARNVHQALDVPVGLISTNWGGSRIEPWITPAALAAHPLTGDAFRTMRTEIERQRSEDPAEREAHYQSQLDAFASQRDAYWTRAGADDPGMQDGWQRPDYDDSAWATAALPGLWEKANQGLEAYDGLLWYRRTIDVPAEWAGKPLTLTLGAIDDSDMTWFNGIPVGSTLAAWTAQREYVVPGDAVKAGLNVIATLVQDTGGAGGFNGPADAMALSLRGQRSQPLRLDGSWRFHKGGTGRQAGAVPATPKRDAEPGKEFGSPAAMYHAMVHPFVPYGIRGALWYQGESNANEADRYRELLPLLIQSWRDAWGQGAFPFGIVQLASFYNVTPDQPVQGGWAFLRDAQLHALHTVEHTGLAVTTDIGNAKDIHPRNKQEVGRRLALWARATVYGEEELTYSGPVFRKAEVQGRSMVLHFDHAEGLAGRNGEPLRGFALGDAKGHFAWADARVEGSTVILNAVTIPQPVSAAYGWCNNPEQTNLVNAAGLPATPFRTDR